MHWSAPVCGFAAYAAVLLALAPATLIDARLQAASEGRLRLAEARGSLWAGAGWIEVRDAQGKAGVARRIEWRVLPGALLRARLAAQVTLEQAARPFQVSLSTARLEITDAALQVPAAAIGLAAPALAPLRLAGEVRVHVAQLSLERGAMHGEATLQWRGAGSALTPIAPLGDYEVRFKAAGTTVHGALRTLEGPLELEGAGNWSGGAAPSYRITARLQAQHHDQLAPLLRLIAVERSVGSFEIGSAGAAFGS